MKKPVAMAVAAHPDDIEFMMAGTLILLGRAGYDLHYMNVARGDCGSVTLNGEETAAVRLEEARAAAYLIRAVHHPPLVNDIEIFYESSMIRKLCAVVREVDPRILLLPSPADYMEDHVNVSRLVVTAAFCRNIPNYESDPATAHTDSEMAVYHALPYGLHDQLRNPVRPDVFVDTSPVMDAKLAMLSCHRSQRAWLDDSQGIDNYLKTMEDMSMQVGRWSGRYAHAEGWQRHLHLGFGPDDFDPLSDSLAEYVMHADKGES